MKSTSLDTIILGQGLAGSLLAWELIQQGQNVLVIDQSAQTSASRIAAGLINPVTGKRLVRQDNIDTHLYAAYTLYIALEKKFDTSLLHKKEMIRIFQSEDELAAYHKRKNDPDYNPYLGSAFEPNSDNKVNAPKGGFKQKQTAYLDTASLLDTLKDYFASRHSYQQASIGYSDIALRNETVCLSDYRAKRLIFCEGYKAVDNPWFNWLPFKLAKGEIMTLRTPKDLPENIINAGKWLLPLDQHTFKFGATYEWHELNEQTTEEAKKELVSAAKTLLKSDGAITAIQQHAGIRPCSKDTLPYIGLHPEIPQLGIFNGFGSKGSLTIPFYARQLSEHMLEHKTIDKKVDIRRYWNKHD